ncbi:MAG: precorrin-4 C(11)-methyltransferase [Lachnospiraceae bacterium]|nr:precorrin-4 C(11)-methyltransferase [Lachnospiraceae bacterium]
MVHFVGAGPGACDLITVRGMELLKRADVIIYAGSLVNPELLSYAKQSAEIYNSAVMTLEEVFAVMEKSRDENKEVVRIHTGEPSIYGAVREQMDLLEKAKIPYDSCPGVSACFGAAASLNLEYTLPGQSQSLIITRMEGRTEVPEKEKIRLFAAHHASMAIYLSTGMLPKLSGELIAGGYEPDTPAAIVYKATWKEEKQVVCTVGTLEEAAEKEQIKKTAVVLVGDVIAHAGYERSKLYDPTFATEFRPAEKQEGAL